MHSPFWLRPEPRCPILLATVSVLAQLLLLSFRLPLCSSTPTMPIMPKSPLSPTTVHSPLSARSAAQPYKLQALSKDADGSGKPAHAPSGILKAPKLSAPPGPRLAISSTDVNQPAYWSISGDFLRTGVHVYTKSGKHVVETPLAENLPKPPRWLQIQFNVLVKEESSWKCEMVMKDLGGISCAKDLVVAVQTGGKSVE